LKEERKRRGREGERGRFPWDSLARAIILGEASKRKRGKGGVRVKKEASKITSRF